MSDIADARFAISDLVLTYAERIDLGDFEGLAELFTHAEVTAEGNDGKFRSVDVKVRRPGLEAKTVRGYYP